MPRPRRNSSRPSSRRTRRARRTVFVLTSRTAARSRAGGRRSPGPASPSAIARRISAATCSCRGIGSDLSILTSTTGARQSSIMVLAPPRPPRLEPEPDALIEEARQRQRRRRRLVGTALALALAVGAAVFGLVDRIGGSSSSPTAAGAPIAPGCPVAPAPHFGSLGAVAYMRGRVLRVVDLASGKDRMLASLAASSNHVAWSPDGRW